MGNGKIKIRREINLWVPIIKSRFLDKDCGDCSHVYLLDGID